MFILAILFSGCAEDSTGGAIRGITKIKEPPIKPLACVNGETRMCTTSESCTGTQTCSNNQWDSCVDTPNDNCPAGPVNQTQETTTIELKENNLHYEDDNSTQHIVPFYIVELSMSDESSSTFVIDGQTIWMKLDSTDLNIDVNTFYNGRITFRENTSSGQLIEEIYYLDEDYSKRVNFTGQNSWPTYAYTLMVDEIGSSARVWLFKYTQEIITKHNKWVSFLGTDTDANFMLPDPEGVLGHGGQEYLFYLPHSPYLPVWMEGDTNYNSNEYFVAHFVIDEDIYPYFDMLAFIDTGTGNLIVTPTDDNKYAYSASYDNGTQFLDENPNTPYPDSAYTNYGSFIELSNYHYMVTIPKDANSSDTNECVSLTDGMDFDSYYSGQRVTVCAGIYYLSNGITISGTEINFVCQNKDVYLIKDAGDGNYNGAVGILITGTSNAIQGCNTSNYESGFKVQGSDNTLVDNISNSSGINGFVISSSSYNTLTNNIAYGAETGFSLWDASSNNTLINNRAEDNTVYGFRLDASNNTVTNNDALQNNVGFHSFSIYSNTITGNTAIGNQQAGFQLFSVHESIITDNTANHNGGDGFNLSAENSEISNNTSSFNTINGFNLRYSHDNNISNNVVEDNNESGFYLDQASVNNSLYGNQVMSNGDSGIYLKSVENIIFNNTLNNNLIGLKICDDTNSTGCGLDTNSNGLNLSGNYICFNDQKDIKCTYGGQTTFSGDTCYNISQTGCGFSQCPLACPSENIR